MIAVFQTCCLVWHLTLSQRQISSIIATSRDGELYARKRECKKIKLSIRHILSDADFSLLFLLQSKNSYNMNLPY